MKWAEHPLRELVRFRSGGTPSKAEARYWNGDIPWLSSKDLVTPRIRDAELKVTTEGVENGTRLMPENTVMFVVRGMSLASEFRVSITKRPCAFNQDLKAVECGPSILPDFLYYSLFAQRDHIRGQAGEASHGTKKLESRVVESIRVRLPSLVVQRKVVAIASAYDDLIENNRRRIELLEEAARLLYREWFVDLRFPGHEHVNIVDGVPDGWERRPVSELAHIYRGKSYSSAELVDSDGQPFVNLKCIDRFGGFRLSGLKGFKGEHKEHHRLVPGDIVVAVTDMTREAMIVAQAARVPRGVGESAIYSMDLVKAAPRDGIDPAWLYGLFRYSSFSMEVRERATGATVLHLQPKHIENWQALVPTATLRGLYSEQYGSLLAQIDVLEVHCGKLAQARDLLLPRLMNGEIAV